jgi:hypothetical protein
MFYLLSYAKHSTCNRHQADAYRRGRGYASDLRAVPQPARTTNRCSEVRLS